MGTPVNDIPGTPSVTAPARLAPDGSLYLTVAGAQPDGKLPIEAGLIWSHDGGRTWGDYVTAGRDPNGEGGFVEPSVIRCASGKWILVTRTEVPVTPGTTHPYKLGPEMVCTSTDGQTWSTPKELPLAFTENGSTAPCIDQLANGIVVFVCNTGTAFSYDEGDRGSRKPSPATTRSSKRSRPAPSRRCACEMHGSVLRTVKPTPGATPQPATAPAPQFAPPAPLPVPQAPALPVTQVRGLPRAVRVRGNSHQASRGSCAPTTGRRCASPSAPSPPAARS